MGQGSENPKTGEWRNHLHDSNETMALRAVHAFNGPLQIIEAGKDDHVPQPTVKGFANAYQHPDKLEYNYMEDWPHSLGDDEKRNQEFQEMLLKWIERL